MKHKRRNTSTAWEPVSHWYDHLVGEKGQYYHEKIIMPNILRLLEVRKGSKILDLGCGQGILSRYLPDWVDYSGVDLSRGLIERAKQYNKRSNSRYFHGDVTEKLNLKAEEYSHAAFVLSLQNLEDGRQAIQNLYPHLKPKGKLILVLNHPCFRIPRQSFWQVDDENKMQYRRINRYLSSQKIPIQTNPSQWKKSTTYSFHQSLSSYCDWLFKSGFSILKMEEWSSDKKSTGKKAQMENRARTEFPLFLSILAEKHS